jgi:hypothetical protein
MEFPPLHLLSDVLGGLVADCGQEAHEVFAPVVFGSPRPDFVAQEGKLLVLVISPSILILAINDFGLLEIQLQPTGCQPHEHGFAQLLRFFSCAAVQDGIVRIPFKRDRRVLPRHPLVQGVVQKQVRQQR